MHILSLNVRGLRDNTKRGNMFEWLKGQKADVVFLQETHCHLKKDAVKWSREWSNDPNDSIWSLGTTRSKGVSILLNKKSFGATIKISNSIIDANGRTIKSILHVNEQKFRLLNVYAPNNEAERVKFFISLQYLLNDDIDAENILGGDFNCVMNSDEDRNNCNGKNDVGQIDLHYLTNVCELEDIWRRRYPNKSDYTWKGRGRESRNDFWLTSLSLDNQIDNVFNNYAPYTDHKSINIVLRTNETERGKGIWKMNTSNIINEQYKESFIEMWTNWQSKKPLYNDIKVWWDIGKRYIKKLTQEYSRQISLEKRTILKELETSITSFKRNGNNHEELELMEKEYEAIHSKQVEGAKIRSKIQWWEEGEKSTKYFHNLEKKNGKDKAWEKIWGDNGESIHGTDNIQKRQVQFYRDLYTSQNLDMNEKEYFLQGNTNCLTEDSKIFLDSMLSKEEMCNAIKKMPNNKSPGSDGIPIEFYKVYWNIICDDLFEVFQRGLEDQQLAYTQYLALIILLYKKGPREDIKNWRPISLLNVDYKILSKVLAERLKSVLPEIIHGDQRGCVPGRYIGENIRLIDDLLFEIENQSENPIILLLDQEKAFDRVEWNWLFSTLESFNFGTKFVSWLKILYKDAKSCIMTNGVQSEYFDISRGIRQGDSLSALLYIIQFEPLAHKLRTSSLIEGISLNLKHCENENIEVRGCQYVDDSNSMLKSKENISQFLHIMYRFEKTSGSKMNMHKSVGLTIHENMEEVVEDLRLTAGPAKVLGVPLGKNKNMKEFWESLIAKMKTKLDIWKSRDLSLEGRSYLIQSIAVSQILYAIEMQHIDEKHIKEIDKIIWDFLWCGKKCTIARNICTLPRHMGGLGLADLKTKIKVKRVNWIIRMLKDHSGQAWSKLIENYLRCLDNEFGIHFFTLKVTDSSDKINLLRIPDFYKECITYFQEMCRKARCRTNDDDEIIWCNHKYLFNGQTLKFAHWAKSGITSKSHLYKEGRIDDQGIYEKLNHKAGYMFELRTIKSVFPASGEFHTPSNTSEVLEERENILNYKFQVPGRGLKTLQELSSRDIYDIFLQSYDLDIKSKRYWSEKLGIDETDYTAWFTQNFMNKMIPRKVKDFNWKLFHGLINTESRLKRMKYSDGICKMCTTGEIENIDHLLFECTGNKNIWNLMENIFRSTFGRIFLISLKMAISGYWNPDQSHSRIEVSLINALLGICRYHIWKIRNSVKYGNDQISYIQRLKFLKFDMESHLNILLLSVNMCKKSKETLTTILGQIRIIM